MGMRRIGTVVQVVGVVFAGTMVASQVVGHPVLFGYVETGSMKPTLDPGDGFVAIPAGIAGPVESGDVIVFQAQELHGGGLTTHRVVRRTDQGYITRGDANPFTDQSGEEPPVTEAQIVAMVWQPGPNVLVIPHLGTVVQGPQTILDPVRREVATIVGGRSLLGRQGLAAGAAVLSVAGFLLSLWVGESDDRAAEHDRSRDRGTSTRVVMAGFTVLLVSAATAAMAVPAGQQKLGIVSAESDSPGPRVIEQGTTETAEQPVGNAGLIPVVVLLEPATDHVAVAPTELRIPPRSTVNATYTLSAPPETGYYREFVVRHRYLAVLPASVIRTLYRIHPWTPVVVIDLVLGSVFYLGGVTALGTGRIRSRSRTDTPTSGLLSRYR